MKLYYASGACSLAPHIVAREAGVTVDLVKVDLAAHKTADGGDFYAINPRGYVPALEIDGGTVLREAAVVTQYLADQKPGAGLIAAAGSLDRLKQQEWIGFIATELHKTFSNLWNKQMPDAGKEITKTKLATRFAELDKHLAGKQYLMGDKFTAPDAYCFTIVNWANFLNLDLKPYANLSAYMARVAARPKVQEALKAEGLLK